MGKLAAFLAGVITGAVALGVTACLVDKHDYATSTNSSCENEQEENASSTAEEESINQDENPVTAL